MNDFEKIEHLLLHKKYDELNSSELKEVKEYFENATDYNDMRDTLMQVKSTLAADKLYIKPSVELKEKLLKQFENTYTNQNEKITGKKRPFYKSIAFQWSAAASIVVLLSISAVSFFNNLNKNDKEMAVNYKKDNTTISPTTTDEELPGSTVETGTNNIPGSEISDGEIREENTELEKPVISNNTDIDNNKPKVYGNFSATEDKILESENAPELDDNEGTINNRNNTTIDDSKDIKGDTYKEELKSNESNTTIPLKAVNEKKVNTTKFNNKDKKKDESNKQDNDKIELGGYMSVNQMVQSDKKDSLKLNMDSLFMDSNKMDNRSRDAKIQMDERKKDN